MRMLVFEWHRFKFIFDYEFMTYLSQSVTPPLPSGSQRLLINS